MPDPWPGGDWLLVDAAGPATLAGLLRDGDWLGRRVLSGGALESLQPAVRGLLDSSGLRLGQLQGVIYACGPGSTIGLRLAALFLRTLLELPPLRHWRCLQYQNLELACASLLDPAGPAPLQVLAPWRGDRLHRVTAQPGPPVRFHADAVCPADLVGAQPPRFALGGRLPAAASPAALLARPLESIPAILRQFPQLLRPVASPAPHQAEEPAFAVWAAKRHSAP